MRYASPRTVSARRPPDSGVELGEVAGVAGFRRVTAGPEPLALARLRALLLEVANGGSARMRDALEGFQSWRSLATLCGTEWTAGTRRSSMAARRVLQRRLRALGAAPLSVSAAASAPVGTAAHLRGSIRPMLTSRQKTHIWFHSAMNTDNVRLTVEEGHDFFLTDDEGRTACVIVARGHLVNADQLVAGDVVSVFGYLDRVAGPRAAGADIFDRDARALAVRAGDDLPLLIRRLPQER
jgi:hypothetical protein